MYEPVDGGDRVIIQDVVCHLPPVGYVRDPYNPELLIYTGVEDLSGKPNDHYWVRQGYPAGYKTMAREEAAKRVRDSGYIHPKLDEFRQQSWLRRLSGMWFYNGLDKDPTYITGLHWYYLEWVFIANPENDGYPNFWESDKEFFYFVQHVIENPDCFGLVYLTKRREGKTAKSVAFGLEKSTRSMFANTGIQSKTEKDARDVVFRDGYVRSFERLPDIFMPVFDTSGGRRPKQKIHFINTPRKGKASFETDSSNELGGWMDWRSGTATAYDGSKLARYIGDEIFKTEGVDIVERHRIVRFCLTDHSGRVDGKAMYTSTCEEIEGKIEDYIKFWKDSDQTKIDEKTGRTKTGLYHYFLPSSLTRNRDKYGKVDRAANLEAMNNERASLEDDPEAYNSLIRKEPETVSEAFRQARKNCVYNSITLSNRLDAIRWGIDDEVEEGYFDWNAEGTKVVWYQQDGGRFRRLKNFNWPSENRVREVGGILIPDATKEGVLGADPYDHKRIEDVGRASKGAIHAFAKYNPLDPDYTDTFILEYANRPNTPEDYYEDVLLACIYLGWKVVAESNRAGLINYFINKGYDRFLVKAKGRTGHGIPGHIRTTERIVSLTDSFIHRSINNMHFSATIEDWSMFDPKKTQKYDLSMSAGYALIGESGLKDIEEEKEEETTESFHDIFGRRAR